MIRVVHSESRIRMLTSSHPGSRIQASKRHPIPDPDPQHCMELHFFIRNVLVPFVSCRNGRKNVLAGL
jgi:hypothetical protein